MSLLIATAELGLRAVGNGGSQHPYVEVVKKVAVHGWYPSPHMFDADRGYRYRPNARFRNVRPEFDVTITLNGHGFHGREFDSAKPENVYRVALIGDSLLAALEVPLEQTWVYRLQEHIEPLAGKRVEVLNFGIAGYLPWNMLKLLEQEVLGYQPDVVVLWCDYARLGTDAELYSTVTAEGITLFCNNPETLLQHVQIADRNTLSLRRLIPHEVYTSRLLNHLCEKVTARNMSWIKGESPASHQPADVLAAMRDRCRERSIPFAVFYRRMVPPADQDLCRKNGIPTWSDVVVVPDLRALGWPRDEHFTPGGNATYAASIAPVFQAMLSELATEATDK